MHTKREILAGLPELDICGNGDFRIAEDIAGRYEIIDFHTHIFDSISGLVPGLLRKEKPDDNASFFDLSGYPGRIGNFDFDRVGYRRWPRTLLGIDGFREFWAQSGPRAIRLIRGATVQRLQRDMVVQHIRRAVVLPINTKDYDCTRKTLTRVEGNEDLIPFASVHPLEDGIGGKIEMYVSRGVRGFKINPHLMNIDIDSPPMIDMATQMAETGLPVISCSGLQLPETVRSVPQKIKKQLATQDIRRFDNLLSRIPDLRLVFAHGGLEQNHLLIDLMEKYANTYADISTLPPGSIRQMIDAIGGERLLFGSDYPFFNQCFPIVSVLRATEDEGIRENIFYCNAKSLLKL